jgi:hypothetical protein
LGGVLDGKDVCESIFDMDTSTAGVEGIIA